MIHQSRGLCRHIYFKKLQIIQHHVVDMYVTKESESLLYMGLSQTKLNVN
jgi:hypothetical protein